MVDNAKAEIVVRFEPQATGNTGELIATPVQEDLFAKGYSFSYEDHLSYGAAEVKTFVFDPTACTCERIRVNPIIFSATAGPIRIKFYAGTTANDDGTLLGATNRISTSTNLPEALLRLNPTGIALGTEFSGDLVPSVGAGVGNTSGGANVASLPFEISLASKYAFTVTNDDGAATWVQIKVTWFEIPEAP